MALMSGVSSRPNSTAVMAMTMISSMSVNARRRVPLSCMRTVVFIEFMLLRPVQEGVYAVDLEAVALFPGYDGPHGQPAHGGDGDV